jgi:hypothetical protein
MSMDLLNRPPNRPKRAVTIADRAVRLQAAAFAASHVPKIMQWWAELYQDEKQPMSVRIAASDRLVDRALGRPTQGVDATLNQETKQILEVRWMPPDPNDRSNITVPEPDSD